MTEQSIITLDYEVDSLLRLLPMTRQNDMSKFHYTYF